MTRVYQRRHTPRIGSAGVTRVLQEKSRGSCPAGLRAKADSNPRRTLVFLLLAGTIAGACTSASSAAPAPASPAPASPAPPVRSSGPAPADAAALVRSPGYGWSDSGLDGPVPTSGSCQYRAAADGSSLPDPECTPGAIDASVTEGNLASTICDPTGYTSHVRPPESLTEPFKYASMSAYGVDAPAGRYELDHLVALEIGGSSDTRNLWPEYDDHPSPGVANSKDVVEAEMHDLVCNAVHGRAYLPLSVAQVLMASDWTTSVEKAEGSLVQP